MMKMMSDTLNNMPPEQLASMMSAQASIELDCQH